MLHVLNVYTVHHFHAQLFHTKQIATIKWNRFCEEDLICSRNETLA